MRTACAHGWPRVLAMWPGKEPAMKIIAMALTTRMASTIQAKRSRVDIEAWPPSLELAAHAQQWAMLQHVHLEERRTGALHVIDVEGAIAKHAGPRDSDRVAEFNDIDGLRFGRNAAADAE